MTDKAYNCGIGPAFQVVGGKWKAVILWELRSGPVRFGQLRRQVPGVSEKMLTQQLRELEQDQLVVREVLHQVPPRVEYALTEWGVNLNIALAAIADWGETYALAMGRYPEQPA